MPGLVGQEEANRYKLFYYRNALKFASKGNQRKGGEESGGEAEGESNQREKGH